MREAVLGGEETKVSRERLTEMKNGSHRTYIKRFSKSRQKKVSIKVSSQVLRIWLSTDIGVEEVSRYKTSNTRVEAR